MKRLEVFLKDSEAQRKYLRALDLLAEANVDLILLELAQGDPVNPAHPQASAMAVAKHYELAGYQRCLAALFTLTNLGASKSEIPIADFGAAESLVADGTLTREQVAKIEKELMYE